MLCPLLFENLLIEALEMLLIGIRLALVQLSAHE